MENIFPDNNWNLHSVPFTSPLLRLYNSTGLLRPADANDIM